MPQLRSVLSSMGFYRKADPPAPPITDSRPTIRVRYSSGGGYSYSSYGWTRDYETLAAAGYCRNSDVYACISLIAQAGKAVKWDTGPGSKSLASIDVINRSGGPSLIEGWLSYLLLAGNSYMQVDRIANGRPHDVYLASPAGVKAIPDLTATRPGEISSWTVCNARGVPMPYPFDDVVQSKLFNPLDPIYGMAPMEAAYMRVEAENEGAALMRQLLAQGFSPGWIEAAKDSIWEDTQVAQLKLRLQESRKRGEAPFLENATWHEMGFKPGETGIAEQHVLSKRDIASVFHVPSQLIGDPNTQTYSNNREARQALYTEAVLPLLGQFREDWNQTIGAQLQSPLAFDKDAFDAIASARAEASDRVTKLFTSGLIMQNEGRRELNYDEVKGGNVFYAPANLIPLGDGAEADPAAPKPSKNLRDIAEANAVAAKWSKSAAVEIQLAIEGPSQ